MNFFLAALSPAACACPRPPRPPRSHCRSDALALTVDVLRAAPAADAVRHARAALPQCAALLAPGLRSSSLKAGSLAALAATVSGVLGLVELAAGDDVGEGGEASPATPNPSPQPTTAGPLLARRCIWGPRPTAAGPGDTDAGAMSAAAADLAAGLLRAWDETAPALAAAPPDPSAAACAAEVVACLRLAVRAAGADCGATRAGAAARVIALLPARRPPGAAGADALAALASVNLEGVRLLKELLSGGGDAGRGAGDGRCPPALPDTASLAWAGPLLDHCQDVLTTGRALPPPSDAMATGVGGAEAGDTTYRVVLECRHCLLR